MGATPHSDQHQKPGAREAPKAGGTEASSAHYKHQNENGALSSNEDRTPDYYAENFRAPGNQPRLTSRLK